jgi:hypothetical protein
METLVSVVLTLIITISVSTAFITILRNNDNASLSLHESFFLLYADQKLREQIGPIILPYWENSVKAAQIFRQQILNQTKIHGIDIINAEIIIKDNSAHGLAISYFVLENKKIYTSNILFSSFGDAVKR